MISPKTPKKTPIPTNDLVAQLKQLGLVLTVGVRILQLEANEGARGPQPAPPELPLELTGIGRQVSVRTELDPAVAGLRHLVEEPRPRRLGVVVGEPHAPGIRS